MWVVLAEKLVECMDIVSHELPRLLCNVGADHFHLFTFLEIYDRTEARLDCTAGKPVIWTTVDARQHSHVMWIIVHFLPSHTGEETAKRNVAYDTKSDLLCIFMEETGDLGIRERHIEPRPENTVILPEPDCQHASLPAYYGPYIVPYNVQYGDRSHDSE